MEPWQRLDRASEADARRLLATCCGSTRWIDRMVARRPFGSRDALSHAARDVWFALDPADWREAFSHHPRIGDRAALAARFAATRALSQQEQSGVAEAPDAVLDALAEGNEAYERRFGYIFIVCATGKRAEEMLALLRSRIDNDPAREIEIAAGEQAKITDLRLAGLRAQPRVESRS
jgi:2-oxo-4-hydroxy-4-carboxy-5-ureidoimidazoline decarboxylase